MGHKVIDSYYVNLDDFAEVVVCIINIKMMLEPWGGGVEYWVVGLS